MSAQVIQTPRGERLVVIPEAEFQTLVEAAEDASDVESIRRFEAAFAQGLDEIIPSAIVGRLLSGENRVRIWREFRGSQPEDLASSAGLSSERLLEIETGDARLDATELHALAKSLCVDMEDLMPGAD